MPHEAEIRTARGRAAVAEPRSILVEHRRAGTAEIKMAQMSGGSLLHLALAGCVFNNVLRMAGDRGISVDEASVRVSGGFTDEGASTGVECRVDVLGDASAEELRKLAQAAFENSTVVAVLRQGAAVRLAS
jgi:uncharacterized OsmC-like protein